MVIVIIGSSIACKSALETLLPGLSYSDRAVIVTREKRLFYSRVMLPNLIAGEVGLAEMTFAPESLLENPRVEVITAEAKSLDTLSKRVILDNGQGISYGKLLITTGASPVKMEVPGKDLPGVFYLRDLEDAQAIRDWSRKAKNVWSWVEGLLALKHRWR